MKDRPALSISASRARRERNRRNTDNVRWNAANRDRAISPLADRIQGCVYQQRMPADCTRRSHAAFRIDADFHGHDSMNAPLPARGFKTEPGITQMGHGLAVGDLARVS